MLPLSEIKRKEIKINFKDYLYMLSSIICIPMSMVLFQLGDKLMPPRRPSLCASTLCSMFSAFPHSRKDEPLQRNYIFLSLTGILFMVNPFNMQEGNTVEGILLVLGGAALFGLYSVMGKISVGKIGSMVQTSISFIFGSLVLLVILLIIDKPVIAGVWPENIWIVLYLSVFVTGLAYLFYFQAIAESNATTGSVAFLIKAAIAPTLAVIILREPMELHSIIGIVLVLAGATMNILQKYKANSAS